ncbi:hypothetical protein ABB37_02970 [Leptomonas pyrrhocoris]|uniref:Uncharacterized protein n=1 Tax=Leptomonas pyrrhocoris TaxID=157538 RepID=A0A0M9G6C8_LEPPY|nr:hypothetical protein ABB37_02970 [Leptomonas pyrrhocoris]XP_015661747.1 hypothetical protein ABB37_02970 [Leptomonas pyrrhocoris]KPA83307.1 hypothetical protein ABB37_02970 [Leptomonas pyrrhocoris]KPA83308.1 hypothetical protein ABB37_02970 [Leptomonas pyrrhocoris]|eukprot:XP_015661746.1 hypothetical protein ABB37_02970 [Leptomonas pyrrhocoris]
MFSAALQQFSTVPPAPPRVANSLTWTRSTPSAAAGGRRHVECDSDGFVDSDEESEGAGGDVARPARSATSSSTSSSDSAWGTFHGGEPQLAMCNLGDVATGGTDDDGAEDGFLFVPDPIFDLSSLQDKPVMPCLRQDQIPIGATVWVVDEDDVATQLNCYFTAAYPPICNGRLSGTVVRHTGLMTLVRFHNEAADLYFSLCVPTSCLSLQPVEAYESSPRHGESYGLCSGAYGMLGPRAVGSGQAQPAGPTVVVRRYLYEAMPAYDAEKLRGTALEKAQELFFQGNYEKALTEVNAYLAASSFKSGEGVRARKAHSTSVVDAFVLRSRVYIFLERYAEALEDARTTVTLEPRWVRSHLSIARAHCGLGQFTEAAVAIAHAYIMLPYSSEVERIKELNGYMYSLQSQLRSERAGCYLILDSLYRKRLRVNAPTATGVSICKEVTPIVATHSVFAAKGPMHHCAVCFRTLSSNTPVTNVDSAACSGCSGGPSGFEAAHTSPSTVVSPAMSTPVGADPEENTQYCSTECEQRASLYRPLEIKHRVALDNVRSRILSKAAVTLNVLPLEMTAMAVRLFLMVVTTHRRLCAKRRLGESSRRGTESTGSRCTTEKDGEANATTTSGLQNAWDSSASSPVCVETALQRLGVYPVCTELLQNSRLEELKAIYDMLTVDFKAEDRTTFSYQLLTQLYCYVNAYFTPVDANALLPPDAAGRPAQPLTVYYLPIYVGCIELAKTISYSASGRRRDGNPVGVADAAAEDQLMCKVIGRPALDEAAETKTDNDGAKQESPALAASNNEANCTVLPATRTALLELLTVAPVSPEHKLRCVPVSMIFNSDAA